MDKKYYFVKDRLSDLGKTQIEFAEFVGISQQKLNTTLNHTHLREFQTSELVKVAEFLKYDLASFVRYVSGDTKELPKKTDSQENSACFIPDNLQEEYVAMCMQTIDEFLKENDVNLSTERKARIFAYICSGAQQKYAKDRNSILGILSALQHAGSALFSKNSSR